MRDVDLIVPIYRNADLVRGCVESLLGNLGEIANRSPRLILVNDSPDDEPIDAFLRAPALRRGDVMILENPRNIGFVRSVNRALAESVKGRRDVILANSDTVTFPGALRALLDAAAEDPQIGFASPRSNNASLCSLPHHHDGTPPTRAEAFERWRTISRTMPAWHFSPTAMGFYLYIAYTILANHGGLSEAFDPGYEEENDLVMRAGKVGQRAILVNHAFVFHHGSASFSISDLDLGALRDANLQRVAGMHPEYLQLVRRYEASPHFRAERMMAGLLPEKGGRHRMALDLTGLGCHHNGTNEHTVAVLRELVARWSDRFLIVGVGAGDSFRFHGLDHLPNLKRADPAAPGLHAVAVRIAQPFGLHQIELMERLAPINIYAMLDTIAEDCGPLAADNAVSALWDHVARHADGLLFNSRFSERQFCTRHPSARSRLRMARLLSTRQADYRAGPIATGRAARHLLVLGNHFPHKSVDATVQRLMAAFPTLTIVAIGATTFRRGNVTGYRSGEVDEQKMQALFADASAVVLPSHVEGFGLGLMHAIATGRPIAARKIPATVEILESFDAFTGIELFDSDLDMVGAVKRALECRSSSVTGEGGGGWSDWVDGLAGVVQSAIVADDLFPRLVDRIGATDRLKDGQLADGNGSLGRGASLDAVLALSGAAFVEAAYRFVLGRAPDEQGFRFYLGETEAGTSREVILAALMTSPEARKRRHDASGVEGQLNERAGPLGLRLGRSVLLSGLRLARWVGSLRAG